ncbi:hypothetical protein BN381_130138 [Candidatus Microthrix parvicella RN1]|uniref:Uncharacterized protein n=1 Tax=Candidatus Neomicrothrix parvicella RN1 TaxID=1229780 RepID=R4YWZ0_9ACTN|nr:hypothetical protein BN381_130138 [Candidatus Microthrix parvicella RN1]
MVSSGPQPAAAPHPSPVAGRNLAPGRLQRCGAFAPAAGDLANVRGLPCPTLAQDGAARKVQTTCCHVGRVGATPRCGYYSIASHYLHPKANP